MSQNGFNQVSNDLDLINFIRATRIKGFALSMLVDAGLANYLADSSYTKPIRQMKNQTGQKENSWFYIQGLN